MEKSVIGPAVAPEAPETEIVQPIAWLTLAGVLHERVEALVGNP